MEEGSYANGTRVPLAPLLGLMLSGALLGAIPAAWATLALWGGDIDVELHDVGYLAINDWPFSYGMVTLASVLALWTPEQPWRAWKAFLPIGVLIALSIGVAPLLLFYAVFLGPFWVVFFPIYAAILWGLLSLAHWVVRRTCPWAGPLATSRDRLLLALAITAPSLMAFAADLVHLAKFNTWP